MNVPPRCSEYTIRKINDTRIVEKNLTRTKETCCPEFYEKDHECISYCANCKNGICRNKMCQCISGFSGKNCDTSCQLGFWGSNCTKICDCESESCNPLNGTCTDDKNYRNLIAEEKSELVVVSTDLPKQLTTELERDKEVKIFENMYNDSSTGGEEDPNYIENGTEVSNNTSYDASKKQEYWDITTEGDFDYNYNLTSIKETLPTVKIFTTFPEDNNIFTKNDERFSKPDNSIPQNILEFEKRATTHATVVKEIMEQNTNFEDNFLLNENRELRIPVEIKYDHISKPLLRNEITMTTSASQYDDKNYLITENQNIDHTNFSTKDKYLINSVGVSAATTIALSILAITFLTIHHIRRNKKKENVTTKKNVGVSTVSVYTTSIFHTPLPDPPIFENPSYLTTMEYQYGKDEPTAFETHVVCDMKSPCPSKTDCREYVYDHPPSTGSYRAASIVEPDMELNQKIIQQAEPVYDEIPCRGTYEQVEENTSYYNQPISLYMNTCGRTKF